MPPTITFNDEDPHRIQGSDADDIVAGLRESLADRPGTESWDVMHMYDPIHDVCTVRFRVGTATIFQESFPPDVFATEAPREGEDARQKIRRIVKNWALDHMARSGKL